MVKWIAFAEGRAPEPGQAVIMADLREKKPFLVNMVWPAASHKHNMREVRRLGLTHWMPNKYIERGNTPLADAMRKVYT